jgi:hypothetical protein
MSKIEKFIRKNFNLDAADLVHVPAIVTEILQEIDAGEYDDDGMGNMSEYTLYDVFDDKLAQRLGA